MSSESNLQKDQEPPGIFLSLSAHASSSSVPASSSSVASDSALASESALVPPSQICFRAFPSVSAEASSPLEGLMQERIDIETSLSLQQPFRTQDSQRISCERDSQRITSDPESQRAVPQQEYQRFSCKPDSQRTFPEQEYHRSLSENKSQEICLDQEPVKMFPEAESQRNSPELLTEQESQRNYPELGPQRLFPEQQPQRLFLEEESQKLCLKQEPRSLFCEQESQRFLPEQEPQRLFLEQERQRSAPEYVVQGLVTESQSQRFHPEQGVQKISSEQESQRLFPEEVSHGISCQGEPGKTFSEQDPHEISVEQEPQKLLPEQESHRISSQSLQNLVALSHGDLSQSQRSPSLQGLVGKRKSFPFEEDQKSILSEQHKNEPFLGFLNQSDNKSPQRSPKRQNTGILLENLKFSSSFQEVSTPETPSNKVIMASLQLGQAPLHIDSCQQSPEKSSDPEISPLSLFHSHAKEKVMSPSLDSAEELKASCMLGSSLQVRPESSQGTLVEPMPSTRHILSSNLLHSLIKENNTVQEGCLDHQKSAFTQTNSMKESKYSCMPTSSIQMRPEACEGASVRAISLDQTFLPSNMLHSSDDENITSLQGSLEHHKSAFTETHSIKELKPSVMLTSLIQTRSSSVPEVSTETLPLNKNMLPPGLPHSPNKDTGISMQLPVGHQKSAFTQPQSKKESKTSCPGVIQNEANVSLSINTPSESCSGSSEQSKHTPSHLCGSAPQFTHSSLHDKPTVLFSEPKVAANRTSQGNILKENDSSVSLQPQETYLAAHLGSKQVYPAALATHSAVLENQKLFQETFQKFQASLGLHVKIPKLAGEDLDLHKLYKQVTDRGGSVKVSKERKWKEVMQAFNISSSATEGSSVLRRIYNSTLHHYEQVYFFGVNGQIVQCPDTECLTREQDGKFLQKSLDESESMKYRPSGIIDSAQALGVDPASSIGTMVKGTIDGKFDNGYLVTVMVGTRKMRGVLYHVAPTNTAPQNASVPGMMQIVGVEPKSVDLAPTTVGRKKKKPEVIRKDPNAPRQNRSGYNFFFAEQRARLKTMQPDKDKAISKMIGELWNNLTEDEKSPYQAQGIKDKERYVCEMKEYKEKAKLPMVSFSSLNMTSSRAISIHASSRAVLPQSNSSIFQGHPNDSKVASSHIPDSSFMPLDPSVASVASPGSSKSESTMDMKTLSNHE